MSVQNEATSSPHLLPCTTPRMPAGHVDLDEQAWGRKLWRTGGVRLTVGFLDNPSREFADRIISHLNAWNKTSNILFEKARQPDAQVRISTEPGGHWSYAGTDLLLVRYDRPTMNLEGFSLNTPETELKRVVRHLAGLTLGFDYERLPQEVIDRIDRPKAYAYFQDTKGWDQRAVDALVLKPLSQRSVMQTDLTAASIMSYQLPGSIMKNNQAFLGGQDILDSDHNFAGRAYPKRPW